MPICSGADAIVFSDVNNTTYLTFPSNDDAFVQNVDLNIVSCLEQQQVAPTHQVQRSLPLPMVTNSPNR